MLHFINYYAIDAHPLTYNLANVNLVFYTTKMAKATNVSHKLVWKARSLADCRYDEWLSVAALELEWTGIVNDTNNRGDASYDGHH